MVSVPSCGFDAFLLPHFECCNRLGGANVADSVRSATGFTGSSAIAIWTSSSKALFVDARYTLQAQDECPDFEVVECQSLHPKDTNLSKWIRNHVPASSTIITDFRYLSVADLRSWQREFCGYMFAECCLPATLEHLNNPSIPCVKSTSPEILIETYPLKYAGDDHLSKLEKLRERLRFEAKQTSIRADQHWGFLLASPEEIAWLLNLRLQNWQAFGFSPTFASFAYVTDRDCLLFVPSNTQFCFSIETDLPGVTVIPCCPSDHLDTVVASILNDAPDALLLIADQTPQSMFSALSPLNLCEVKLPSIRQQKNVIELDNAREVHRLESAAIIRLLAWISTANQLPTEMEISQKLEHFRHQYSRYKGPSFSSIIATGSHSAIVHYVSTPRTDTSLKANNVLLLDVGGHYWGGTTDMTRSLWLGPDKPSPDFRKAYIDVLRGHIALANLTFPDGEVTGGNIDAFARQFLWSHGQDYRHGTGHGVGNYLVVHEGPVSLSPRNTTPLQAKMIVSIEPGIYFKGQFGIRLENLYETVLKTNSKFCQFDALTLVPFDDRGVDTSTLTSLERQWLRDYHLRIMSEVLPYLQDDPLVVQWLMESLRPFL